MIPEPEEAKQDIWVLGFRESDERPEKALGRVFGIDSVRARRLIASMPAVVKREVTPEKAAPIVSALRKIGARVALVPTGASQPPGKPSTAPPAAAAAEPPPEPSGGLGDIESRGIDFGTAGPPSSGSHVAFRGSLPAPRISSMPAEPARVSVAPEPEPTPEPPKPIQFLEPRPIPEAPEPPPKRGALGTRAFGVAATAAGAAALVFASLPGGSVFGESPDLLGAVAAAGAIALLLFGVQVLVSTLVFDAEPLKGGAVTVALLLGGAVGATAFFIHHVDPAEAARQQRAATMTAIRQGRLPEARLFLTSPDAQLAGLDRAAASEWVEALYTSGARQVYVVVDYDGAPELGTGVAISLPLTQNRRSAVAAAVRQRAPSAPPGDGEWWLISLE